MDVAAGVVPAVVLSGGEMYEHSINSPLSPMINTEASSRNPNLCLIETT